jgi:hydroxymethylglutaryl-CoA lyase
MDNTLHNGMGIVGVYAQRVAIYEVAPRDGLQNESEVVATETKLELIERLARAGLRHIEVTSFVSPEWIPQLADGDALAARLPAVAEVRYTALVPNLRGYDRLRRAGRIHTAAVFISASETHNRRNVNRSIDAHLERLREVAERAGADGVPLRAYVATAFGCPYEGSVAADAVVRLASRLFALGADEIALADTMGVGSPAQVGRLISVLSDVVPLDRIALHCHDTYGRGLANLQAGYEAGVRIFDASLGGLGGCPYAPGAAGNVATEDVVDLFGAEGVETGVDLHSLVETTGWLERQVLRRPLASRVSRARRAETDRG